MLLIDTDYTTNDSYDLFLEQHKNNKVSQQYAFLYKYFEEIQSIDIKGFNTLLFKEDIQNLTDEEFDEIYNSIIEEILEKNIFDFEMLLEPDQTVFTKNNFIDYIDFYMHTLPYSYLKNILTSYESIPEFYEYLMADDTTIKSDLKKEAKRTIELNDKFGGLVKNLGSNISAAKNKDKYNSIVGLLDRSLNSKKSLYEKYIEMIDDVNLSNLQNLITAYIESDNHNLKG